MSEFRRFNVWFSETQPTYLREGQLWVNTSTNVISSIIGGSLETIGANANEIISQITGAAPETLNTLEEIAQALNDNPNILDLYLTSTTASATYLSQASASTTYATIDYVDTEVASVDLTGYLTESSASTTYLTQNEAGSTYLPIENPQISGTTSISEIEESVTVSATAATGTINYNILDNHGVTYYTSNASGNWTLNVRGNSSTTLNSILETNKAMTFAFAVTNGGTAYYQTAFQIDGASVSPKWQGGSAPSSGNTNSTDIYSFTIVKTADSTYTVWASQTKFA